METDTRASRTLFGELKIIIRSRHVFKNNCCTEIGKTVKKTRSIGRFVNIHVSEKDFFYSKLYWEKIVGQKPIQYR